MFGGIINKTRRRNAEGDRQVSDYKEKLKLHRVFVRKDGGDIKVLYGNNEVDEIVKERNEYKHRAEVAERALLTVCTNIVTDEEDDLAVEPRARVLYKAYLKQAEKEFAEERKDD